nr:hypothetical protein [uncultured Bacillus sp.]
MDYYHQIPYQQIPHQQPAVDSRQQGQLVPGGQFVPGFLGGMNRRIERLERQVERLDRRIDQIDRRLDRIERRLGLRQDGY